MTSLNTPLQRLEQTKNHLQGSSPLNQLSLVHGPLEPPLLDQTLGDLLDEQCRIRGEKECLVMPWYNARWTFSELQFQAKTLAKAMLAMGVQHGDRIGILAGNCEEYVAVFFAAGYIGAILVVLNSTYTAMEAKYVLNHSGRISVAFLENASYLFDFQVAKFYS